MSVFLVVLRLNNSFSLVVSQGAAKLPAVKVGSQKKLAENPLFIELGIEIRGSGFDSQPGQTLGGCSSAAP